MAFDTYDLRLEFRAEARFVAGGDLDIILVNPIGPHGSTLWWVTTDSDDLPTIDYRLCPSIEPGGDRAMQLLLGKRLWLVGEQGYKAAVHS